MRVPTVTLRHKTTGETVVLNEADYAMGVLPNLTIASPHWERIGETRGEDDPVLEMMAEQERKANADSATAITLKNRKTGRK